MYRERKSGSEIKRVKGLFVWVFVLIAMAAIAVGGVEQAPAQTGSGSGLSASEGVSADGKLKFIAFEKDRRIPDGLRVLAALYKKNIVPSSKVDGQLTVSSLHDVTFEQAMDAILGHTFKYEEKGNVISVYTAEEYKNIKEDPERMIYKVFTLYYITAEEASKLIKPVLSGTSVIQASSPAENQISSGGGGGGSAAGGSLSGGGGGDTMALHDTIVVYDFPENIEKAKDVIKAVDVRPKQVLVEATILSVVLIEGMELGVDWNLMAGVALDGSPSAITNQETVVGGSTISSQATSPIADLKTSTMAAGTPIEQFGFATQGGDGLRLGITTGDVRVLITALESVTDTTVLANPKILAINKQEGTIQIGTRLGYRSSTTISTGGIATEGEVEFLDAGTVLTFRPYIGNDGYVRMDIHPKDSSAALNADGVPTENVTQCKTNILVKDGETIVIGGLFRDVITTTRKQVPLLGDIPIIGALFRGKSDSVRREEVIVLLTTHIIEEPSEVDGEARAEDIRRKRFGAKDELESIGRAKMAEDRYAKAARYYIEGDNESAMKALDIALRLRPSYLEAIRLRERILEETDPNEAKKLERIVLGDIDEEEASMWMRK